MNFNNFTIKSQEAVQQAVNITQALSLIHIFVKSFSLFYGELITKILNLSANLQIKNVCKIKMKKNNTDFFESLYSEIPNGNKGHFFNNLTV